MELIDSDRDTATALMELHVSSVGNRMNEVMKVLTIIATLFIPLSFITGLYGMNFDTSVSPWNMPELRQPLGYVGVLSFMALAATGMLVFFWRKGWLGSRPS
jgi:magnesium transporter